MNDLRVVILVVGALNVGAAAVLTLGQAVGLNLPPWALALAFVFQATCTYLQAQLESWRAAKDY